MYKKLYIAMNSHLFMSSIKEKKLDSELSKIANLNYGFSIKKKISSIIIVLDYSFATLRTGYENDANVVYGVDLRTYAVEALHQLKAYGAHMTLLINKNYTKNLDDIREFLPEIDEFVQYDDDLAKTLISYREGHSVEVSEILFVSSDRTLRGVAADLGFVVLPHITIANLAIRAQTVLHFVKIYGNQNQFNRIDELISYYFEKYDGDQMKFIGIASQLAITKAVSRRLSVNVLSLDIPTEDPLLVHIDQVDEKTTEYLLNYKILYSEGRDVLLALDSSIQNDTVPFHHKHGHYFFLIPDPSLFKPAMDPSFMTKSGRIAVSRWPLKKTKIIPISKEKSSLEFTSVMSPIDTSTYQQYIDKYSGQSNLDADGQIISRHCRHADNSRVIQALMNDLKSIGYTPYTFSFSYNSTTLQNVIADLPGRGAFKAEPDIREQIRRVFFKYPAITPSNKWISDISSIVGEDWLKEQGLNSLPPLQLRRELENIFLNNSDWWIKDRQLDGLETHMIIVGCHLDSTGSNDSHYNPTKDEAFGKDDDGSGMAATLSIAKYMSQFRGQLSHTVRFCFFNAEEVGLIGSNVYASVLKEKGSPINSVICTDMIGYNSDNNKIFEIHAGHNDSHIRDISLPIAKQIASWAHSLGSLAPAQIYKGTQSDPPLSGNDSNRDIYDGAIGRSDHFSFQQQGYPACVVSEDFFTNLGSEPSQDPNPNYHSKKDTVIDISYAVDITSAISLAVKELAT
jgi:peptidase M28-like protein